MIFWQVVKRHWTAFVGAFLVFVGLWLSFGPEKLTFYQKLGFGFVIEIGFAFLIAWGIGLTVELSTKREYNKYVQDQGRLLSQNVFGYLYSVHFPRSAFDVISKYIFSEPIIKTKIRLECELQHSTIDLDWVKMHCTFDYTLKNLSDNPVVDHPIRFYTSKVSGMNEPNDPDVGLKSIMIGSKKISEDQFEALDKAADDEVGQQKFETKRTISAGEELRVRIAFTQHKRTNDNDLWQSNSICKNLELDFKYDSNEFDVFIEPIHPSNKFDTDQQLAGAKTCRMVTINEPLLPKNGVFMWWNGK